MRNGVHDETRRELTDLHCVVSAPATLEAAITAAATPATSLALALKPLLRV